MNHLSTILKEKSFFVLFFLLCQLLNAQVYDRRVTWNLSTDFAASVTACATRSNGNSGKVSSGSYFVELILENTTLRKSLIIQWP
jgi:hypothetical protein